MSEPPSKSSFPSSRPLPRAEDVPALLLASPDQVGVALDAIVVALATGSVDAAVWAALHDAAANAGKVDELVAAYRRVARDRRFRVLPPAAQREVLLAAGRFADDVASEPEAAIAALEKVLASEPLHGEAFERLERLFAAQGDGARRADLYVQVAPHQATREAQAALLRRAADLIEGRPGEDERVVRILGQLVKLLPEDADVRRSLGSRLVALGRASEAARIFEQGLAAVDAASDDARWLRSRLVMLYTGELREPERAAPHVEALLELDAKDELARATADQLLRMRPVAARIAAALERVHRAEGRVADVAAMLAIQVEHQHGARRLAAQRRLAAVRLDELGDAAGAVALLEAIVRADPSDEDARRRLREVSASLDRVADAAPVLARAGAAAKDPKLRARIGVEVGEIFLASGDAKRARAAYQSVLDSSSDEGATLSAARELAKLHERASDWAALATVLELLAEIEDGDDARDLARAKLGYVAGERLGDLGRAIGAYRALVGTARNAEALAALERLYEQTGDARNLIEVLDERARLAVARDEARLLAVRAAETRSTRTSDRGATLAAWRDVVERFGPSREAFARMIPLLEQEGRLPELEAVLESDAELAPPNERAAVLAQIGSLRATRLGDVPAGLDAFREALRLDPEDRSARAAVERLLGVPEHRLAAAALLEPVYAAAGPSSGLARVLEAKAEASASTEERLESLARAIEVRRAAGVEGDHAVGLSTRGLREAIAGAPSRVPEWLGRVRELAAGRDARELASRLVAVLSNREIDRPELVEVAAAAADALVEVGDAASAVPIYRRAVAVLPRADVVDRADLVLERLAKPKERAQLLRAAAERTGDAGARVAWTRRVLELESAVLKDAAASAATARRLLALVPGDSAAEDALERALELTGDFASLEELSARRLADATPELRPARLLALAEASVRAGHATHGLDRFVEAIAAGGVDEARLARVESLAREHAHPAALRAVLAAKVALAIGPLDEARALVALGVAERDAARDARAAADAFRGALALFERAHADDREVLDVLRAMHGVAPDDRRVAARLRDALAAASRWPEVVDVERAIVASARDESDAFDALVAFEPIAAAAALVDEWLSLLDAVVERFAPMQRAAELAGMRARALARVPGREDDVAAIYRELLTEGGGDAAAELESFGAFLAAAPDSGARRADRRWLHELTVERAIGAAKVDALVAWAEAEERELGDRDAAVDLYRRVLAVDPEHAGAIGAIARLLLAAGDVSALVAFARSSSSRGAESRALEVRLASALVGSLGRPVEALELVASLLDDDPTDDAALAIALCALGDPAARSRAAAHVDHAAGLATDPARVLELLSALVAMPADAPELRAARRRWIHDAARAAEGNAERQLELALVGASELPGELWAWDSAERAARSLHRPERVAAAYRAALERPLDATLAEELGRRAVEFHEEWIGDEAAVTRLLERVLEASPGSEWAFDRLKLAYDAGDRYADLFELFDRRVAATELAEARAELLDEAAQLAKDFANDPERAIGYLETLLVLRPGDARIEGSLERLYERQGQKRALVRLLEGRLERLDDDQAHATRRRIVELWMEEGDLEAAAAAAERWRKLAPRRPEVFELLERLLAATSATTAPAVRGSVARVLADRHRAENDAPSLARALGAALEVAGAGAERRPLLDELARLEEGALGRAEAAFEHVAEIVSVSPGDASARAWLADLARETFAFERQGSVLVTAARALGESREAAATYLEAGLVLLGHAPVEAVATALGHAVALAEVDAETAVAAARALETLFRDAGRDAELCDALEGLARLAPDRDERRRAWSTLGRVALERLGNFERAERAYEAVLELAPSDAEALDGLVEALARAAAWGRLVDALERRAAVCTDPERARADLLDVARIRTDELGDRPGAIAAWRKLRERHGQDERSFDALSDLLAAEGEHGALVALYEEAASASTDRARVALLLAETGDVLRDRLGDGAAAADAYARSVAADPTSTGGRLGLCSLLATPELRETVVERARALEDRTTWRRLLDRALEVGDGPTVAATAGGLLAVARAAWTTSGSLPPIDEVPPDADAARALDEGVRVALAEGRHEDALALLVLGASLPFDRLRRRTTLRDAAIVAADLLGARERAIELHRALFAEDATDAVALDAVARFATLLDRAGLDGELLELWETQAAWLGEHGERAVAAELWTRAGGLSESRLGDLDRAVRDYERGAALGGLVALEALARAEMARGSLEGAVAALGRLVDRAEPPRLTHVVQLADALVALGRSDEALARLTTASRAAAVPDDVFERLVALHHASRGWAELAALHERRADEVADVSRRLAALRQAAAIHREHRGDPGACAAALERAAALDPSDSALHAELGDALAAAGRVDEAISRLRARIERYGARRPKERALLHLQLARMLVRTGDRAGSLIELDVASKIDPASPTVLLTLARVAFEEDQLERAQRTYRGLLLVLRRGSDGSADVTRAEVLLDLADIALRQSEPERAKELVESALEAARETPADAARFEVVLRARGRFDLLARALEARLARASTFPARVEVLSAIADVTAEGLGREVGDDATFRARVAALRDQLRVAGDEALGVLEPLERLFERVGDREGAAEALERRVVASANDAAGPVAADALYRLAASKLASAATIGAGVALLERALEADPRDDHAADLLRSAAAIAPRDERLLRLYERVCRASGRDRALLTVLAHLVALGGDRAVELREAVDLARTLDDAATLEAVLRAALAPGACSLATADEVWALATLADARAQAGDAAEAASLMERAGDLDDEPSSRRHWLEAAALAANSLGDLERAARDYERVLALDPADREAYSALADVYERLGDAARLVSLYAATTPLVEAVDERTSLRLAWAAALARTRDGADAAIAVLGDALVDDPGQMGATVALADLLASLGRDVPLRAHLEQAATRARERADGPAFVELASRLGAVLERLGERDAARDAHRAVTDWEPSHAEALAALARLADDDDVEGKADALERALAAAAGERAREIAEALALLRRAAGDDEGEERALTAGLRVAPNDRALRARLLASAVARGDLGFVEATLWPIALDELPDLALLRSIVAAARAVGGEADAKRLLDAAIERAPGLADLHGERGRIAAALGDEALALDDLVRAFDLGGAAWADEVASALEGAMARLDPAARRGLQMRLVDVLRRSGRIERARAELVGLVLGDFDDGGALAALADLEEDAGAWDAAVEAWQRLVDTAEGDARVDAGRRLASALERAGRVVEARPVLEWVRRMRPDDAAVRAELSHAYEAAGDRVGLASLAVEPSAADDDADARFETLRSAAAVLGSPEGDYPRAARALEEARALRPDDETVVVDLARTYLALDRRSDAVSLLRGAIASHRDRKRPALGRLYAELGRIEQDGGRLDLAFASFVKGHEIAPSNGEVALALGVVARELSRDDVAISAFRAVTILRTVPPSIDEGTTPRAKALSYFYLAQMAMAASEPRRARVMAEKALAEDATLEEARELLATLRA